MQEEQINKRKLFHNEYYPKEVFFVSGKKEKFKYYAEKLLGREISIKEELIFQKAIVNI